MRLVYEYGGCATVINTKQLKIKALERENKTLKEENETLKQQSESMQKKMTTVQDEVCSWPYNLLW